MKNAVKIMDGDLIQDNVACLQLNYLDEEVNLKVRVGRSYKGFGNLTFYEIEIIDFEGGELLKKYLTQNNAKIKIGKTEKNQLYFGIEG